MDLLEASEFLIKSQDRVYSLLRDLVRSDRLPQSLLFAGPQGAGKSFAAIALASWINCSCGDKRRCSSCSKIARLEHPDLHLIYPVPYGDWQKSLAAVIEAKRENFFQLEQPGSKTGSIGIDLVRHVIEKTSKQPFEGKRTVVVFFDAHSMTLEAQNAFLKVLEEPPSSTVFILVTEYPDRLLPTITSRCQAVRFGYLSDEAIEGFLERFFSLSREQALRRSVLAMGDVERAVQIGEEGFERISGKSAAVLRSIVSRRSGELLAHAEDIAFGFSREEAGGILDEVIVLVRMVHRGLDRGYTEIESQIIEESVGARTEKILKEQDLALWIEKISTASRSLMRNADVELTLAQLFLDLAGKWY